MQFKDFKSCRGTCIVFKFVQETHTTSCLKSQVKPVQSLCLTFFYRSHLFDTSLN